MTHIAESQADLLREICKSTKCLVSLNLDNYQWLRDALFDYIGHHLSNSRTFRRLSFIDARTVAGLIIAADEAMARNLHLDSIQTCWRGHRNTACMMPLFAYVRRRC